MVGDTGFRHFTDIDTNCVSTYVCRVLITRCQAVRQKGIMEKNEKQGRLQVVIDPEMLIRIDDYRHQRRFAGDVSPRASSKSDAIRTLVRLALEGALPPEHRDIIKRMHKEQSRRRREEPSLMKQYRSQLERTHLALAKEEIAAIDRYRAYANESFGTNFNSRADVVRYLLEIGLEGTLPNNHLDILDHIRMQEARIREMARQLWEAEGSPANESEDKVKERWFKAKAQLVAQDGGEEAGRPDGRTSAPNSAGRSSDLAPP
jgi:hypothetical protein